MSEKKNNKENVNQPVEIIRPEKGKTEEPPSFWARFRAFFTLENIFKRNRTVFIFSLILALVLWTMLVAFDTDQNATTTIANVPITVSLGSGAQEMGLQTFGTENLTADVVISGRQYDLQKISAGDIQLTAQPSPVTGPNTYKTMVMKASSGDVKFEFLSVEPKEVNIIVDRYVENREFKVKVEHNPIGVPAGHILETAHASQDTITISGPETEINRIDGDNVVAKAYIDQETLAKTTSFKADYLFYDSVGSLLEAQKVEPKGGGLYAEEEDVPLELLVKPRDLMISVMPGTMQVVVPVYEQKEMNFVVNPVNGPADMAGIDVQISPSAKLAVRAPTDDDTPELEDQILDVDFSGIMSSTQFSYGVKLPPGYKAENESEERTVTVTLNGKLSKFFDVTNIQFSDQSLANEYEIVTPRIEKVQIIGGESIFETFLPYSDIIAKIEKPADTTADQIEVPVYFEFPNQKSCWVYQRPQEPYTVTIRKRTTSH